MKTTLKISFWIIFALCLLLPIWANTCLKDYAVTVTTMLSGLCGLATLYVAILLYDRYGMESKSKERTIIAIEETIAEFKKVHFILCFYSDKKDDETPTDYIISLFFQSKKENVTKYFTPEALSTLLYYKTSGMYVCSQLAEIIQSKVFLPKSIAEAAKRLSVFEYETQNIDKDTRPITTLTASSDRINNQNDALDGSNVNIPKQQMSVMQFIDAYFGVKEAIIDWYKENGIDTTNMNL
ncbi:hypothetical protein [Xylanibacter brevis]|uniref:hypothetical protein n=1 Tax=Xylanibacter brevis TaxID=83231 RepID=UPI000A8BC631|nr:hypothetical protein [Xylanibacter brevis]